MQRAAIARPAFRCLRRLRGRGPPQFAARRAASQREAEAGALPPGICRVTSRIQAGWREAGVFAGRRGLLQVASHAWLVGVQVASASADLGEAFPSVGPY